MTDENRAGPPEPPREQTDAPDGPADERREFRLSMKLTLRALLPAALISALAWQITTGVSAIDLLLRAIAVVGFLLAGIGAVLAAGVWRNFAVRNLGLTGNRPAALLITLLLLAVFIGLIGALVWIAGKLV